MLAIAGPEPETPIRTPLERSANQWWSRFEVPVFRNTRSGYRNNARQISEEHLYQLN